jgi:hypothetical protein
MRGDWRDLRTVFNAVGLTRLKPPSRQRPPSKMAITTALPNLQKSVTEFLSKPRKMLIDGKWVEAASGKAFETYNPATGEVLARVAEGDREDIDRAVKAARRAFESGPRPEMSPSRRTSMALGMSTMRQLLIHKILIRVRHLPSVVCRLRSG